MWNINKLTKTILVNDQSIVNWCQQNGLIKTTVKCPNCYSDMRLYIKELQFRCCLNGHIYKQSVRQNTWFGKSKLKMDVILIITYMFANGCTKYKDIIREGSLIESQLSMNTIADWISYCREICMIYLDKEYDKKQIGGIGHIVQIDESKVGKRKYNKGRYNEGQWIFGMVDIGSDGNPLFDIRLDLCPNNNRSSDSLIPIIQKHVKPGTTIWSDQWKAYDCLKDYGYKHFTVNHSENFVNPESKVHTQHIECIWRQLKRRLHTGGNKRVLLAEYLCEFLWRQKAKFHGFDLFDSFIKTIVDIYNE